MTVVTRFAPSPTGMLHIGGARTALFNSLYAKRHGGKFLLRIEDTDRERSTESAVQAILDGLAWLGLAPEGEPVFQHARADRHREVVRDLLARCHAYRDYQPAEELALERDKAKAEGRTYRSPWRERNDPGEDERPHVVRFKGPTLGETVVHDLIQGEVRFPNAVLDDLVLLRTDGAHVDLDGEALTVTGRTTAEIGGRAFAAGVELHELRSHSSGLEEIYFQLTAGQEQFAAPAPGAPAAEGAAR